MHLKCLLQKWQSYCPGLNMLNVCISSNFNYSWNIDGLMQERCNSIANALELHLSCINPSIFSMTWSAASSRPIHLMRWEPTCGMELTSPVSNSDWFLSLSSLWSSQTASCRHITYQRCNPLPIDPLHKAPMTGGPHQACNYTIDCQ